MYIYIYIHAYISQAIYSLAMKHPDKISDMFFFLYHCVNLM